MRNSDARRLVTSSTSTEKPCGAEAGNELHETLVGQIHHDAVAKPVVNDGLAGVDQVTPGRVQPQVGGPKAPLVALFPRQGAPTGVKVPIH